VHFLCYTAGADGAADLWFIPTSVVYFFGNLITSQHYCSWFLAYSHIIIWSESPRAYSQKSHVWPGSLFRRISYFDFG